MKEPSRKMLNVAKLSDQFSEAERISARLQVVKDRAQIPAECGPDIAPAPARGGFVLERIKHLEGVTRDDYVETAAGCVRRSPIRRADAFDAMIAAASRAKREWPLTPSQIAVGRRYHDLVELLSADGTKLSQLQASFGGNGRTDWMDQRMVYSDELERMRRRLGIGPVIVLRRIRPSQRKRALAPGEAAPIMFTRRDLIDAICVKGLSIKQVLKTFDWQDNGRNCKATLAALAEALDAMIGYRQQKSY